MIQLETYLFLILGGLFAHFWELISWITSCTNSHVLSGPWLLLLLTVDTTLSVIKYLGVGNWLLKIAASLWNVLLNDGSISNQSKLN